MDISELIRNHSSFQVARHPWEMARCKVIKTLLNDDKSFKTIIDFGSGDMYLLRELELEKKAKNYVAVDSAYSASLLVNLKNGYTGTEIEAVNSINEIDKKILPADCLLFLDVIEHVENDIEVLKETCNLISKNDGLVLITVPAFQSVFSQHDKLLKHYRRYNLNQLSNVCAGAQLTVTRKGYFFFSLLVFRIFQLFLEKIKISKPDKSIDNWKGGKFITSLLVSLLWLDFTISNAIGKIGIRLPGLSCYCLCHPSRS